ncbi:MAG: hypothetical protein ACI4P8_05760 [Akkermansia sp.]
MNTPPLHPLHESHAYDDIIAQHYPPVGDRPRMSPAERAAQFSPFAALSGHDEAIAETARLTEEEPQPDETLKWQISELLQRAARDPALILNILYFIPDPLKSGGRYAEACGSVRRLDPHTRTVRLHNGTCISIASIADAIVICN